MNNNKNTKINMVIYLFALLAVFVMLISTSYAYYVKSIKNNDNTKVVVKTANMLLRYYEGNQINAMNIKPNWEETLDFCRHPRRQNT